MLDPKKALETLKRFPFSDLGSAKIDHFRGLRQIVPEAIYGPGKTPEQCGEIALELLKVPGRPVILTRANESQVDYVQSIVPGSTLSVSGQSKHGATLTWRHMMPRREKLAIVTAGTADIPIAMETAAVLKAFGIEPESHYDCGVAGIERILSKRESISEAEVVVVVAGMEGALASVVGGLTSSPVIAVPTSAGYGSSFEGITALVAMMASCSAGITVVGIDNGFGAACAAMRILGEAPEDAL